VASETRYSFCEAVTAGPLSPWHIRPLDDAGQKLSGGVTTASLCDHVKPFGRERGAIGGWDVDVPFVERHLKGACKKCVSIFRLKVEAQETRFTHANVAQICEKCKRPYWRHPAPAGYDFLHLLCDGTKVKL
jgi:hypothetical protein